jgi:hypothetical protein
MQKLCLFVFIFSYRIRVHNKMKIMHLPSSLKIKILYKNEDIAFLFTLMQQNDIDVFHKYMYTCT